MHRIISVTMVFLLLACAPDDRPVDRDKRAYGGDDNRIKMSGLYANVGDVSSYGVQRIAEVKRTIDLMVNRSRLLELPKNKKPVPLGSKSPTKFYYPCDRYSPKKDSNYKEIDPINLSDDYEKFIVTNKMCSVSNASQSAQTKIDGEEVFEVWYRPLDPDKPFSQENRKIAKLKYYTPDKNSLKIYLSTRKGKARVIEGSEANLAEGRELIIEERFLSDPGDPTFDKYKVTYDAITRFNQKLKEEKFYGIESDGYQKVTLRGELFIDKYVNFMSDVEFKLIHRSPRDINYRQTNRSERFLFKNESNNVELFLISPIVAFDPECETLQSTFFGYYVNKNDKRNRFFDNDDIVENLAIESTGQSVIPARFEEVKEKNKEGEEVTVGVEFKPINELLTPFAEKKSCPNEKPADLLVSYDRIFLR